MENNNVYITINTSEDYSKPKKGYTTLRQAIVKLNDLGGKWDKAYINFERNVATPGSWVIAPEWPLPPILYGNVYLNYSDPKNITLSGKNLNPNAENNTFEGFNITMDKYAEYEAAENFKYHFPFANPHSSLLTIGDGRHLEYGGPKLDGPVVIKNINFIDNYALGEDAPSNAKNKYGYGAGGGGGGGLGAGAGISIVSDVDVEIYDSVFQNLEVRGGKGAAGNDGAKGYLNKKNVFRWPALEKQGAPGMRGGRQGSFVVPMSSEYRTSYYKWADGGKTGSSDLFWRNKKTNLLNGNNGGTKAYKATFGVGGAGGGGGGAGLWGQEWAVNYLGKGGRGGDGQASGHGAGGGGGGGGGKDANILGRLIRSNNNISYASGGKGGTGSIRYDYKSKSDYNMRNGLPGIDWKGGKGGDGLGLGGAIAVLNPKAKLNLERVDFINIRAKDAYSGRYLYTLNDENNDNTFQGPPRKGVVTGNSIMAYEGNSQDGQAVPLNTELRGFTTSGEKLKWLTRYADVRAFITEKYSSDAIDNLIKKGTSFVRDTGKPRIRDTFILLKSMVPEIITIQYERPESLLRNINIDSSKLESEINDIYKKIIPIENPEDIKNKMYKKILFGAVGPLADIWSTKSDSSDLMKASSADFTEEDKTYNMSITAGLSIAKFAYNTILAVNEYQEEIYQNNANIQELSEKTKPNRDLISAEPINVGTSRSVVRVKNFRIGEDIIYLEGFSKEFGPKFFRGATSQNEDSKTLSSIEIHTANKSNQGNASTRIAEITFDPDNVEFKTNALDYLYSLTSWDEVSKRWVINNMLTKEQDIYSRSSSTSGGPAGELVILDRPTDVPFTQEWSVSTQDLDDIIIATDGNERISTSDGNDQVFPGIGRDTINGGASFDWVNYLDIKQEINVTGGIIDDPNNPNLIGKFDVKLLNSVDSRKQLQSTLTAVESISSFGASRFNMKALPLPSGLDNISQTAYVIRSGSGSEINGSSYSDHFIISLMKDENSDNYLSKSISNFTNSRLGEDLNRIDPYLVLDKVTTISGGGGDDQLTFAFEGDTPTLALVDIEHPDKELENFQAVIQDNNTIIAYVKDIDSDNIKIGSNSRSDEMNVLRFEGIALEFDTLSRKEYKLLNSQFVESTGFEKILGSSNEDILVGRQGGDILDGREGSDKLIGGSGNDSIHGNQGDDEILGGLGKDLINGGRNADLLNGNRGDDLLFGNTGNDTINGGAGDDFIAGGKGLNQVSGGEGYDSFYLQENGKLIIDDFDPYKDKLTLSSDLDRSLIYINDNNQLLYGDTLLAEMQSSSIA